MNKDNEIEKMGSDIVQQVKLLHAKSLRDIKAVCDNLYSQTESFFWLQKRLSIKGELPPLRGWPASPDFLLRLHIWVCKHKPKVVVETGSGATTLVIADALRKNGIGKLYSFEHLNKYAENTLEMLSDEFLTSWVEMRVGNLVQWKDKHLNPLDSEKISKWYPLMLDGIEEINLLVVDGPPESTCNYARYPALPVFFSRLAPQAEVWMDDTKRQDEKEICQNWADDYGLTVAFYSLEKGLGILTRP